MNADRTIIDSAKKVVRAIKVDSRRRDIDGAELVAASVASDMYKVSKSSDVSLIRRFFSFIASIFRWNKGVKPKRDDNPEWIPGSCLMTEDGFYLATEKQEKININE